MSANTPNGARREPAIDWKVAGEGARQALADGTKHTSREIRAGNPTYLKVITGLGLTAAGWLLRPIDGLAAAAGSAIRFMRDRSNPEGAPSRAYDRLMLGTAAVWTAIGFFTAHPEAGAVFWVSNKTVGDSGRRARQDRTAKIGEE
jgi:hypothetical protein